MFFFFNLVSHGIGRNPLGPFLFFYLSISDGYIVQTFALFYVQGMIVSLLEDQVHENLHWVRFADNCYKFKYKPSLSTFYTN